MNEEIYKHLPRWRRIIRDLATDAGIKKFANTMGSQSEKTHETSDSSDVSQSEKKE